MLQLILLIGIPGVGKTTWAKAYCYSHPNTILLSSDDVRLELTGSAECNPSMNKDIYNEMRRRAKIHLIMGRNVVIDSTNVCIEEWLAYKKICPINCLMIAKCFPLPPDEALKRIETRQRKIPREILEKKWIQYQKNSPSLSYFFDLII